MRKTLPKTSKLTVFVLPKISITCLAIEAQLKIYNISYARC